MMPDPGRRVDVPWCAAAGGSANFFAAAVDFRRPRPSYPVKAGIPARQRENDMKVMVIVKADADTEAGVMPSRQLLAEMGDYNEALARAGILLAGEGLHPSRRGVRVRFEGKQRNVIDGPFAESKELVAGFWLWQVRSLDEAVEWLKRAPFDGGAEVEIRAVFEADDFGEAFTAEMREQEQRVFAEAAARATRTH